MKYTLTMEDGARIRKINFRLDPFGRDKGFDPTPANVLGLLNRALALVGFTLVVHSMSDSNHRAEVSK